MLIRNGVPTASSRALRARRARAGLTLIEVLCALTILLLSVLGFAQAITASARNAQATKERTLATEAARRKIEELEANVFPEIFWRYNEYATDDPGGAGTAQGAHFAVSGLHLQRGDADGFVGDIVFPTRVGLPGSLREDSTDAKLGMPRDLNADGVIDSANHGGNYRILPVLVRVQWQGAAGNSTVELRTMLGDF
ncbi:MAG: prepilin-type N-terminal cleavage/methylation domain-containing protein [Planctomycetes bacterium]|nr:prepilin-type N-terminal cleavage/methylation domain-containing protein [Planctomycetota bacterium]